MNILLQFFRPYLTPMEADQIREEANALNPKLYFVMADWLWIELRVLTEKKGEFLERLQKRSVKFRVLKQGCPILESGLTVAKIKPDSRMDTMKFDDLDEKMRVYETALDHCVLPEMFMVVRIDGRGFRQLTRRCCGSKHSFNPTLPVWTACAS